MSKFIFNGDEERYYPDLGLLVSPGDIVDVDTAPDDRFSPVKSTPTVSKEAKS